ncbi:hypothetical protein [Halodesulfurarchaeum sp.]|uniref:hypothetical protein n=1 Tax=Halodesulfurarchaeum sp. TaxID=1980530 RepID=UPI001BC7A468|nr:hypothetical protein [Halodesulfurarchaeum sp.]
MDSESPTAECIAGEQPIATGDVTFVGNKNGNSGNSVWPVRSMEVHRRHRQHPHGYGRPS